MHLMIVQEFMDHLRLLKYLVYHPHQMQRPAIATFLLFIQLTVNFMFEFINIQILFSRATVFFTIGSYVTVDLLRSFNKFHFMAIEADC
jgi:hypothetical protein